MARAQLDQASAAQKGALAQREQASAAHQEALALRDATVREQESLANIELKRANAVVALAKAGQLKSGTSVAELNAIIDAISGLSLTQERP